MLPVLLAACVQTETPQRSDEDFQPEYLGIETRLFDADLVSFVVRMKGARDVEDVADYARCAAAQYTLIRGYGFLRHVRTTAEVEGGVWGGDGVYTISKDLPQGVQTLYAPDVLAACEAGGIPSV